MKTKANSMLNTAGTRVYKFNKHHDNTVIAKLDHEKPDFKGNAINGIKLRKKV